ncbi:TetR/AcrR family transcriptional regulator [Cupriavidus respiraculi]|uniref:TetR/AcrR family transcriptional regulator n=1 Tax=Cupriavidus respiraculi TaxID=195930 RepID=UPI002ADE6B8C|nr:TetR/AcrR family transcriptional regulator [Cupriavidus respiraculi]
MQKGQLTRTAIVEKAFDTASKVGFEQLSLADLAADTNLSKSGLYAHFKSKEALQSRCWSWRSGASPRSWSIPPCGSPVAPRGCGRCSRAIWSGLAAH